MRNKRIISVILGGVVGVTTMAQTIVSNNSPYAFMGDQTKTLDAKFDVEPSKCFDVIGVLPNGETVKARFDYNNHTVTIEDVRGEMVAIDTLSTNSKAFTTMDPLAEKYPQISPYAYCANNPLIFIDPTGRKIDLSLMSKERQNDFLEQIYLQRTESELFNTLYSAIEASEDVYYINYGELEDSNHLPKDGQFAPNEEGGGIITFLESDLPVKGSVLSEELFHAYQHDNRNGYAVGDFNREFEAKTFATLVGIQYGGYGEYKGMDDFQNRIVAEVYGEGSAPITPESVATDPFVHDYLKAANIYSNYNVKNGVGNLHYRVATHVNPYSLQKVVRNTYK